MNAAAVRQQRMKKMFQSGVASPQTEKRIYYTVIGLTAFETIVVTLALVPPQLWTRLLPGSSSASLDGPFPPVLAPIIADLFKLKF